MRTIILGLSLVISGLSGAVGLIVGILISLVLLGEVNYLYFARCEENGFWI